MNKGRMSNHTIPSGNDPTVRRYSFSIQFEDGEIEKTWHEMTEADFRKYVDLMVANGVEVYGLVISEIGEK